MKSHSFANAMACIGAVVGAGFASGREVAAFFSRYGVHGWWLIAAASALMTGLCRLCMRETIRCGAECWCELYEVEKPWLKGAAQICAVLLLILTAGAMIAASGQMAALIWNVERAYVIGAAGTLFAAWLLGYGSMKPLGWLSGILIVLFLAAIAAGLTAPGSQIVQTTVQDSLLTAAVRSAGYASMNMTLAIGVVSRCASRDDGQNLKTAFAFGIITFVMMGFSHCLYSKHPEWLFESFPLVRIVAGFGRTGFLLSALLVYLSVFTSLTAVIYALRCAVEEHVQSTVIRFFAVILLPALVSCIGFSQIVDRFYAPAGLLCLFVVFYPLFRRRKA